jgi:MFS transporter, PPP family, 3-phenylpropionic acid transporter
VTAREAAFRTAPFGALWACYYGSLGLFNPYSPLWLAQLGHSTMVIGAFAAVQAWTRIVAPYGWGWLADHGGRRVTLLRVAAAASLCAAAGLWWVRDAGALALAAVVAALFLANGAFTPIAETLILRHLHSGGSLDARRYGKVRLWGSVGFITSVLVFGVVLQRLGIGALPLLTLGMFALLALATWRLPRSVEPPSAPQQRVAIAPVLRRPVVRWFFAGVMLTVLAHSSLYAFFSLFLDERGYDKAAVGLMWAVSVAAEIAFFAVAARHFGRIDPYRWLVWAALASALRFALTAAFGNVPAVLVVLQLSHALTFAAQHMACTSLIAAHFPDQLRARGSALYSTLGYGVPGVVGGLAGGLLSERLGLAAVFWAASVAGLAAAGCCHMAARADSAVAARLMSRSGVKAAPADVP